MQRCFLLSGRLSGIVTLVARSSFFWRIFSVPGPSSMTHFHFRVRGHSVCESSFVRKAEFGRAQGSDANERQQVPVIGHAAAASTVAEQHGPRKAPSAAPSAAPSTAP